MPGPGRPDRRGIHVSDFLHREIARKARDKTVFGTFVEKREKDGRENETAFLLGLVSEIVEYEERKVPLSVHRPAEFFLRCERKCAELVEEGRRVHEGNGAAVFADIVIGKASEHEASTGTTVSE